MARGRGHWIPTCPGVYASVAPALNLQAACEIGSLGGTQRSNGPKIGSKHHEIWKNLRVESFRNFLEGNSGILIKYG